MQLGQYFMVWYRQLDRSITYKNSIAHVNVFQIVISSLLFTPNKYKIF